MFEEVKSMFHEMKPELVPFFAAMVMGVLQLIAQPEGKKSFWGSTAEILSISIMAVAIAGIARLLGFEDPNVGTFIGCAIGLMGYKTTRKLVIFLFRGQIK